MEMEERWQLYGVSMLHCVVNLELFFTLKLFICTHRIVTI